MADSARRSDPLIELSIRTKLTAALAAVLALFVTIGALGLVQLHGIDGIVRDIREVRLPQASALAHIRGLVADYERLAARRTPATAAGELDRTAAALSSAADAYLATRDDADDRATFAAFRAGWAAYEAAVGAAPKDADAGESAAAADRLASAARAALDRLWQSAQAKMQMATIRADGITRLALILVFAGTLLAGAVTVATIVWATRRICSPLLDVSRAMRLLIAGDDTVTIAAERRGNDEIGILIGAASKFRSALVCSREFAAVAEQERERLHAAVSNMPVGLSMFDGSERVIICNGAYRRMYDLPHESTRSGTALARTIADCSVLGASAGETLADYRSSVAESRATGSNVLRLIELRDGRTISFAVQAMDGGGWIAVHEDITERRRAEEQIAHMARHDALTDLPNRILFRERIEEALRRVPRGESIAVICLDLDHFKNINDTLGHPVGDLLLGCVAERLRECVRGADTVARLGGDEFAIVQIGSPQPQSAVALAHRIIETVSAPYEIDGQRIVVGISAGIAVAPFDGDQPDVLIKHSDMALYYVKAEGRGTFRFFNPQMDARMQARRRLELELRHALEEKQFELYYQPVIDLARNEVASFEALLRWRHPERGIVAPGEFIPLAEEIGLIVPMGEWILQRACRDAMAWPDDIKVAVNLSPVQFKNPRLLDEAITALAVSNLPARRLELEITENVLLVNTEATLTLLHRLHDFGIHIAMDDFGTGYSSLSYLRMFPFDRIKIDRSFVTEISQGGSSLAVIRAVTGLSASLAMETTAEGVETTEQLDQLRAEGLHAVQGYLFARPCPFAETADLLVSLRDRMKPAA